MSTCINEKPYGQVIRGEVTEINHCLLYFTIDRTFRVYVDITKPLPEFPYQDSVVEIINPKKFSGRTGTAIIGPETTCNFPSVLTGDKILELFCILKENNVDENELVALDYILRRLEPVVPENAMPKCLITLIRNAPVVAKGSVPEYKRNLTKIQIKLPGDLNFVNDNSDLYTFMKFDGMCSFNVYPNRSLQNITDSCAEYLFGILDVDPITGCFSLSDKTSKIPVKFYTTVDDLYRFKNSLVMVKKWTVFTEVFQEKSASSLKYILLTAEDIIIIKSMVNSNQERLFYGKDELWGTGQRKTIFLQTVRISEVIYGYNEGPECWIEALISEKDDNFSSQRMVYIILSNDHIAIVPFLKEHVVYQLFYNEGPKYLKIEPYKELNRLRSAKGLFRLGRDTIFQETIKEPLPQNNPLLDTYQDVENFVKTTDQNQMFSFCFKISRKELRNSNSYSSWIAKRHDDAPNFGIPGKNIQMRLTFRNPIKNFYIDLYLSDRDNHVTPLGLVDDMKVKVKHVQVYRNKYIKTNIFSSFEILEYCSEIMFSSVNLSFRDRSTWNWRNKTPKTLLGMVFHLPQKCIVHGSFLFQAVCCLKITPVCDRCKRPSVPAMPCHSCHISDRDLNVDMSICVQDAINPTFYMNTGNKYFLFELIGLRSKFEIKQFCNAFLNIGELNVDFCNLDEFRSCTKNADSKIFLDELIKMIRVQINFNFYPMVDAVCIKQKEAGSKPWKIIEFVFI